MASMTAPLRKALQARSAEELTRIRQSWAVTPMVADDELAMDGDQGLVNIIAARFAWETLSPEARDLLHQMIEFQVINGVPREDLQKLARQTDVEFVAALSQLEQNLMLIETRPDAKVRQRLETRGQQASYVMAIPKDFSTIFTTIHKEIYGTYGDRSKMSLADLLTTLDPKQLQTLYTLDMLNSANLGLSYYAMSSNTDGLAKSLAGKLVQLAFIEIIWEKLDPTEQKICRWLCRADGDAEVAQIQDALGLSRDVMAQHTRQLENYALAFDTFSGQQHKLFIGRGIFKVLRTFIGELDQMQEKIKSISSMSLELEEAPPIVHEAQSQLLYDLAIVVNATYQMVIEPTQAGYVPKRLANKIFPLLHGSRPVYYEDSDYYLDMLFSVAQSLDLIHLQQSTSQKSRYTPGPKLGEWTHMEAFEQTRWLLDLWEKASNRSWSDIAGANFRPSSYGYYSDSHAAREGLLGYLVDNYQPGQWYNLAPILLTIKARNPLLLREHSRNTYLGGRNRKEVLANWDHLDSEIITGMIASSLHEMGLISLGYQSDSPLNDTSVETRNPDAFQFTELAAQVMWDTNTAKQGDSPTTQARTLIVQPNFELMLLQPDYPTLYKLLPFTKVEQIEMVSRLTLTQESVRRGVEAGYGVEQIIRTLQTHNQKELPQNVLYTLQDWGRLYKDATISQIILLEVSSEAIADEICASSKLRSLDMRRLGPCAITIGGQVSLQVLRTTLEKEGVILHIQGDILSAREFASAAATSGYGRRR